RLREEGLGTLEIQDYKQYLKDRQYEISILETTKAAARLEGWKDGQREEKIKNAKAMRQLGITLEIIAQVTGLSMAELETLN
ncbi:hypothetical protein VB711_19695, partial [Cronbergia sp. UHCC 0137]|uniref:hypothetical protein n=1 Tax=Cronbergia sp. UHCC 0137 TaxID=3110239 RepID=UPI002B21807B